MIIIIQVTVTKFVRDYLSNRDAEFRHNPAGSTERKDATVRKDLAARASFRLGL